MASDVRLPLVGEVSHRSLLYGGGAAVAVVGLLYLKPRTTSANTPDTSSTDTTDQSDIGLDDMAGGGGSAGSGGSGGVVATSGPTSNSQWAANVHAALDGTVDAAALSAALGDYLTGH